jgi:uncharacterized repeat protein (TIGR03843 family)
MPAPERVPAGSRLTTDGPAVEELLRRGELTVRGRLRDASNAVLYCEVEYRGERAACVYKPVAGERPLWDFPDGTLAQREVAAYFVSEATGWGLVPPTVLRDGPYGEGMCQLWIDVEPEDGEAGEPGQDGVAGPNGATSADDGAGTDGESLLALVEGDEPGPGWKAVGYAEVGAGRPALLVHADDVRLRRLAVLDAVINNADRKGGHLLPAPGGRLYAIDHGVTFNAENKLRTLLWGWAGEPLPEEAVEVLRRLAVDLADGADGLGARLSDLLTATEVGAVRDRIAALLASGRHPEPSGDWPAIPWPPI